MYPNLAGGLTCGFRIRLETLKWKVSRTMSHKTLKRSKRDWWRSLIGSSISAMAGAGSGFLGMNGAHGLGVDVPMLNWKSLGVLLLTSGLTSVFLYLKQSPLPPTGDTTIKVREQVTTEAVSPTKGVETKVTQITTEHGEDTTT